jgi:hypothetical protein
MRRLFAPVDVASLAVFRVAFGSLLLVEVVRFFANGWIASKYVQPTFHFTYYGFEWVRPWPGAGMYAHFAALGVLAACITLGFATRAAAALFFVGWTYVFLLDQAEYLNHFYLVSLFSLLLVFVPSRGALSLDARLRPSIASDDAPAWSLWVMRTQMAVVYVGAALAKVSWDWLVEGQPMRLWLADVKDMGAIGALAQRPWVAIAMSWGGFLLDLLVVPGLLWKRTRAVAFVLALGFHLANSVLFRIGIFPWMAIAATTLFFEPDWPRRVFHWARTSESKPREPAYPRQTAVLLAAWLAFQVLMPLRHWLYPGPVDWTEEGHRFSWHMMLREKRGTAAFHVTDPATGRTEVVRPAELLTERQVAKMVARPDMILQFAHHLARRRTATRVRVHAHVMVGLNGRRERPLVNPSADLAAEPRTLRHAWWIMPLKENP